MPKERKKSLCMDTLRHAEYYGMLQTFDDLYAKSKSGEKFPNLMELILSQDNIMLAYRNIKSNTGSYTAGTDKTCKAERHSETQRQNKAAGDSLHLG